MKIKNIPIFTLVCVLLFLIIAPGVNAGINAASNIEINDSNTLLNSGAAKNMLYSLTGKENPDNEDTDNTIDKDITDAIQKAYETLNREDIDAAWELVNALPESEIKAYYTNALNELEEIYQKYEPILEAIRLASKAQDTMDPQDIDNALLCINELLQTIEDEEQLEILNGLKEALEYCKFILPVYDAIRLVDTATASTNKEDYEAARIYINELMQSIKDEELLAKLQFLLETLDAEEAYIPVKKASGLVEEARKTSDKAYIEDAINSINSMLEDATDQYIINMLKHYLNELEEMLLILPVQDVVSSVENAYMTRAQEDIDAADILIEKRINELDDEELIEYLKQLKIEFHNNIKLMNNIENAVIEAEKLLSTDAINSAFGMLGMMDPGINIEFFMEMSSRLSKLHFEIGEKALEKFREAVALAEEQRTQKAIDSAFEVYYCYIDALDDINAMNYVYKLKKLLADTNKELDIHIEKAVSDVEEQKNLEAVKYAYDKLYAMPYWWFWESFDSMYERLDKIDVNTKYIPPHPMNNDNDPIRILFIGNSLTIQNDIPGKFRTISRTKGRKVHVESISQYGWTLKQHWYGNPYIEKLTNQQWDYVVLQEHGTPPLINDGEFYYYSSLFNKEIQKTGAQTIFYITARSTNENGIAMEDLQKPITDSYMIIARALDALVLPGGPAWVEFNKVKPDVMLHSGDNLHPGSLGAYLIASTLYSVIFKESAAGAWSGPVKSHKYYQSLSLDKQNEFLALFYDIAWNTTKKFTNYTDPVIEPTEPDTTPDEQVTDGEAQEPNDNKLGKNDNDKEKVPDTGDTQNVIYFILIIIAFASGIYVFNR